MAVDLVLARKRFEQAQAFEEKQQRRELEDLSFYEGDGQWPDDIVQQRKGQPAQGGQPAIPGRPIITVNKVREPIRHVVNQERDSELGVEIVPADDFHELVPGTPGEAEIDLREGLVRRIQRESHAIDARVWGAERAAICGRGYWGVLTRYLPGKSWDQEVFVRRFYNQGGVLLDPAHEQPDGSDAEFGFVGTWMSWEAYKADYPRRAKGDRNGLTLIGESEFKTLSEKTQGWFQVQNDTRLVRVVEYWDYRRTTRGLALLKDGSVAWDDELDGRDRDQILDTREVIDKAVKFSKLDGSDDDRDPLEETDWPGHFIPIIKVVGEEIQPYDEQRRFEGMVRPARDSQRGFNYMVAKWVETIGLSQVPALMLTPAHVEGFKDVYQEMATRNWPWLPYNDVDPLTGRQLPPPIRPPVVTEIQAIAGSVQLFDQAIKSTTAVPDPTLGNVDASVRSGKGIQALALNALKATSHFGDNFRRSVNYEGLILNDLLYPIYGTRHGRQVRIYTKEREPKTVQVSVPAQTSTTAPNGYGQPTPVSQPPQTYSLTPDVNFNVTISVTKNYDTLREQESSTVMDTISSAPEYMLPLIGDLAFKYQDGPGHRELADRMQYGLRPEIQAALQAAKSGQPAPDPRLMQLQAQIQQLQGLIQNKTAQIQAQGQVDLAKTQYQEQQENLRAAADNQTAITKAEISAAATTSVAQAKIDAENLRSYVDALETRLGKVLDLHMAKLQAVHDLVSQGADHAHEATLQGMTQAHERAQTATQADAAMAQQIQAQQAQPATEPGA